MAKNNVLGRTARDSLDWNNALEAICWLAAVRRTSLREIRHDDRSVGALYSTTDILIASVAPDDPYHRARAIAEIEQAYVALRRAEPTLEAWPPVVALPSEPRGPSSVWMLVGSIWISTLLVVAGAIGAIIYLLG